VQVINAADDGVNSNPESNSELLDTEDATFISHEDETFLGEEVDSDTWHTNDELELESEEDAQADDGDCNIIKDKSSLGYELP